MGKASIKAKRQERTQGRREVRRVRKCEASCVRPRVDRDEHYDRW